MAEVHPLPADMAEELSVESHAPYMKVWAILAILTGVEYVYALFMKNQPTMDALMSARQTRPSTRIAKWSFRNKA